MCTQLPFHFILSYEGPLRYEKCAYIQYVRRLHVTTSNSSNISYFSSSKGHVLHDKRHQCTPDTRATYGCPGNDRENWQTTDQEYVKFAARLITDRSGEIRDRTIERYKQAFKQLYPNQPVPLTSDGEPVDHSEDDHYPCFLPWYQYFLENCNPSTTHPPPQPIPPSAAPISSPHINQPAASSSHQSARPFHPPSIPSSQRDMSLRISPSSQSEGPSQIPPLVPQQFRERLSCSQEVKWSDWTPEEQIDFLKSHSFTVNLEGPNPRLEKILPQMKQHLSGPPKKLHAFFVLCPFYSTPRESSGNESAYETEQEITIDEYEAINNTSKGYIQKCPSQENVERGRVKCYFHQWVRVSCRIGSASYK